MLDILQHEFLDAIADQPRGWIAVRNSVDVQKIIEALARYFPREKILIVAKNIEEAKRLAKWLRRLVVQPVTCRDEHELIKKPQIHVDTIGSFVGQDPEHWTVVVMADRESALASTSLVQLCYMKESLRYALLPFGCQLDQVDRLRLEAFYGEEVYHFRPRREQYSQVSVLLAGPSSYPPAGDYSPLEWKRATVWHNLQRNRHIALIAQAVRSRDWQALRKLGVEITPELTRLFARHAVPRVAILVETPEHARALGKLLPGWPLLVAIELPDQDTGSNSPVMDEQSIITRQRARWSKIAATVIIRAEGTARTWHPDFGPSYRTPNLLVIDFQDDFDERVIADGRMRRNDYRNRGWTIVNEELT